MSTPPATTAPAALTHSVYLARSHRHYRADSPDFDEEIFGIFESPEPGVKAIWKDANVYMNDSAPLSQSQLRNPIDRELLAKYPDNWHGYVYKENGRNLSCSEVNEEGGESIMGWCDDDFCDFTASVKRYEVPVSPELIAQILAAEKAKQSELSEERQPREKPSEKNADADSEEVRPVKRQREEPQESEGADPRVKRQRADSEDTLVVLPEWPYPGCDQPSPLGTQSEDSDSDSQDYDYEPRSAPTSPFEPEARSRGWTSQNIAKDYYLIQLQDYDEEEKDCSARGPVEVELCEHGRNGNRNSPKVTVETEK